MASESISTVDGNLSEVGSSCCSSVVTVPLADCSVVSAPPKEEEYCKCEAAKIKELYLEFYGNPGDHAGGAINVGQWGKLPNFKGPNIWVPPWLDFRATRDKQESQQQPMSKSRSPSPNAKEKVVVRIDAEEQSIVGDFIELCRCGDPCYARKSQDHVGGVGLSDIISLSDVLELESEPHDLSHLPEEAPAPAEERRKKKNKVAEPKGLLLVVRHIKLSWKIRQ